MVEIDEWDSSQVGLPDKVYGTDHRRTLDIDITIKDFMILLVV